MNTQINEALDALAIEKWLRKMKVQNFKINPDLTVDVDGNVSIFNRGLDNFPFKWGHIKGNFLVRHNKLRDFFRFPHTVDGDVSVSHNSNMIFTRGTNMKIGGKFKYEEIGASGLEGIASVISKFTGGNADSNFKVYRGYNFTSGGLGLVMITGIRIENLQSLKATSGKTGTAFTILEKYIGQPDMVFDCHEELIAAGCEQFAKL